MSSSLRLISVQTLALNAAVKWRVKLAPEKLHCADSVHNPPIITAVTQNHGDGQESRQTARITVFTVIVIP